MNESILLVSEAKGDKEKINDIVSDTSTLADPSVVEDLIKRDPR